MKFLIAGLGNPGAEYEQTRHNAGFMALDRIAREKNGVFSSGRYGHTCIVSHRGRSLILLKPDTYMNLSGKALRYYRDKESVPNENLLVLTDDIALPFGKMRLRGKGSAGGHNGLKSIIEVLGTEDFARLRLGIGSDYAKGAQVDFVLSAFSDEERKALPALMDKAMNMVFSFCLAGVQRTMSDFND